MNFRSLSYSANIRFAIAFVLAAAGLLSPPSDCWGQTVATTTGGQAAGPGWSNPAKAAEIADRIRQANYLPEANMAASSGVRIVRPDSVPTVASKAAQQSIQDGDETTGMLDFGSALSTVREPASADFSGFSWDEEDSQVAPVSYQYTGCKSCRGVGGGCRSCMGGGYGQHPSDYPGPCGVAVGPYWFGSLEALYIQRRGERRFSLIRDRLSDDVTFDWAPRLTIGRSADGVNGWEFVYTGEFEFGRSVTVTGAGDIDTLLFDGDGAGGFDGTLLDPFNDADTQFLSYLSDYSNYEFNRVMVGWDVARILWGVRYIQIDERLLYTSSAPPDTGDLLSQVQNDILALQIGMDLLYPITYRLYADVQSRAAVYANFSESFVRLRNNGSPFINTFQDDTVIGGLVEVSGGLRYQLNRWFSVRASGELWYLSDMATSLGQVGRGVTGNYARQLNTDNDMLYVGGVFGAELRY
jgi:hypothetical protein